MTDALSIEQPGGPPLRVSLKTLLANNDANAGDESSDDDDNSTATGTSLTGSTGNSTTDVSADDDAASSRSSASSSSSEGGFGNGVGDDEWKPGALLAGFGSAPSTYQCLGF